MRRFFALAGLALTPLLAGCAREATASPPAPPPPAVDVARPVVRDVVEWDEYLGRLAATESVDVRARVGGFVDSIHFTDGQLVERGALLFVIDPRPFRAALNAADAEVRRLEVRLELAKNERGRSARLLRNSAISAEEHDTRAKAVDEAAAALDGAQARREQARLDVEFTEVRAPMRGRASRHLVSVGNLISGGTSQGTLLTTIVAVDQVHAYFDIDEQAFLRYARLALSGERASSRDAPTPVQVSLADDPDTRFDGVVDFLDSHLDGRTGTLRQRALVPSADPRLLPGVFVRLRLPGTGSRRAVLVPDQAVGTDQTRRFVFVVDPRGVVSARTVTPGRLVDGLRVIQAGLQGDETLVVRGVQRVRPGAPVTPQAVDIASVASGAAGGPGEALALLHRPADLRLRPLDRDGPRGRAGLRAAARRPVPRRRAAHGRRPRHLGFIVLVGLAAKNAILIVEFAKGEEDAGRDRFTAAVEASRMRLRPILMTSLAFILGVLPLVVAAGPGFELRQALGTAVFSGMLGVTVFGLLLTPVFYVVLRGLVRARPTTTQTLVEHGAAS